MKAEYRRDLQNNYLILQSEEEEEKNSYQLKMAQQNESAGLFGIRRASVSPPPVFFR